ncbi:DNA helicase [Mesorhizobium sp. CAU 1741]|uniref:DNA helicase n=1 Tax=Mesorhizobium sp. CAU 1741 TaxID=3140366 RepID=UPI00325BAC31
MHLSAPIYRLKRQARLLARHERIPLHHALDRVAAGEGFSSWSLLAAKSSEAGPEKSLFERLSPGDLLLVAARPGQGKTLLSLGLAIEAIRSGRRSAFFSLEYTEVDILSRFEALGVDPVRHADSFTFDRSDDISGDYMIEKLSTEPRGTLVVIDYLQLLDQRRDKPPVAEQLGRLKSHAKLTGHVLVFISQIDRRYDPGAKSVPDVDDLRMPNAFDVSLFDMFCFLHAGTVHVHQARGQPA